MVLKINPEETKNNSTIGILLKINEYKSWIKTYMKSIDVIFILKNKIKVKLQKLS